MKYIVLGNLPRKSNSRMIIKSKKTGKPMIIKSQKSLACCVDFAKQMLQYKPYPCIEGDVKLKAKIFYKSRRNDVSSELLCDMIEKVGLVKNDRQIRYKVIDGRELDKDNPRVEFELEEIR